MMPTPACPSCSRPARVPRPSSVSCSSCSTALPVPSSACLACTCFDFDEMRCSTCSRDRRTVAIRTEAGARSVDVRVKRATVTVPITVSEARLLDALDLVRERTQFVVEGKNSASWEHAKAVSLSVSKPIMVVGTRRGVHDEQTARERADALERWSYEVQSWWRSAVALFTFCLDAVILLFTSLAGYRPNPRVLPEEVPLHGVRNDLDDGADDGADARHPHGE